MKKARTKILSVIVIISLLLSAFAIQVFANESEQYNSVAHHYFESIGSRVPSNVHGSCVYVAMSMLLSFYDMYWYDGFVAVAYEHPSIASANSWSEYPNGTPWMNIEEVEGTVAETSLSEYRNFIQNNWGIFLHMYLLSIGIGLNLHPQNNSDDGFGINIYETIAVLDEYFDIVFGEADYYAENGNNNPDLPVNIHATAEYWAGQNRETVLNAIGNQVSSGNPVIFGGYRILSNSETDSLPKSSAQESEKTGHAMVAYNIDDNGDIMMHKGHGNSTSPTTTFNNTEYQLDIDAVWIEINKDILPHECSEKYNFMTNSESFNTCSCQAYKTLHPSHTHELTNKKYLSQESHKRECKSGCGYVLIEVHSFVCQDIGGGYHLGTCECGYTVTQIHTLVKKNPHYSTCIHCGYTKNTNGDIIEWPGILNHDDEEETE